MAPGRIPLLPIPEQVMPDPLDVFPALTPATVKRECSGPQEFGEQGYDFGRCPDHDGGHLWFHGWCIHCHTEEP